MDRKTRVLLILLSLMIYLTVVMPVAANGVTA